jgi:thymidylate synthase (FAD)
VLDILESEKEMVAITATYIDHCGSDLSVVNAARVSFGKNSDWDTEPRQQEIREGKMYFSDFPAKNTLLDKDTKLIHYLAKHKHISPFGHAFASFHVKAPIFVARQLVKHKFLRWNEISRRYVDDEPEFYVPEVWRGRSADKKQGSEGVVGTDTLVGSAEYNDSCKAFYQDLIDSDIAPEQARMILPQSTMTEWYWSGSLDAFAAMCRLRCASDTQYETRIVADQISEKMAELFPVSWLALTE